MGEDATACVYVLSLTLLATNLPVFWLVGTLLIGMLSGWHALMRGYPDRPEPGLIHLRRCSGRMGRGVALWRGLELSACPTGLRVEIAQLLGPFNLPFFVPWSDISAVRRTAAATSDVRLTFGQPALGVLTVSQRTWRRLSAHLHPL